MYIIPINGNSAITPFQSALPTAAAAPTGDKAAFQGMFQDAVTNLEELNAIKNQDTIALTLGNLDDIGAMQVNSEKAEVALQMLVQMRNKMLEGYQEIMRTNI